MPHTKTTLALAATAALTAALPLVGAPAAPGRGPGGRRLRPQQPGIRQRRDPVRPGVRRSPHARWQLPDVGHRHRRRARFPERCRRR